MPFASERVLSTNLHSPDRSLPAAITGCALLGGTMGVIDYAGSITGDRSISKEEKRNRFFKHTPPPLIDSSSSD